VRRRAILVGSSLGVAALAATVIGLGFMGDSEPDAEPVPPVAAGELSYSFDEAAAVVTHQDEFSTTLTDPNGVSRVEISIFPMQVYRDGAWVPLETTLEPAGAGAVTAPLHPLEPLFAPSANASDLVSVTSGGYTVTMSLPGADSASPQLLKDVDMIESTDAVIYEDVLDGADLLFGVTPGGIRTALVVHEPPTDPNLTYEWLVDAPGLTPVRDEHNDLNFVGADGEAHVTMPIPGMWDSSGQFGDSDGAAVNIEYDVIESEDGSFLITLRPDVEWMLDASRVYPLYVDPGTQKTIGSSGIRGYKSDGYTANDGIRIGDIDTTTSCCYWRTVLKHELSTYVGKRLLDAQLYGAWNYGTTNTFTGGVYHATSFSYSGVGAKLSNHTISSAGWASDTGLFNFVATALNTGDFTGYIMLRGYENKTTYTYKKIYSTMYIWYVNRPVVGTVTGPVNGEHVFVNDIVMSATGTEYTGAGQQMRYKFTSTNGGAAWTSPWVEKGAYRIPDSALTPGTSYSYSVETRDKYPQSPIVAKTHSTYNFHIQAAPTAPTDIRIDGVPLVAPVETAANDVTVSAVVSDPDGGEVWATFTVRQNGIVVMDSVPGSRVTLTAGGTGVSEVLLPYQITAGSEYTISVRTFDGHLASDVTEVEHTFTGPPRTVREIPSTDDTDLGATS